MRAIHIVLLLVVLETACGLAPMLCQKDKGLRIYRRNYMLNCTYDMQPQMLKVVLRVPSYKQQMAGGHWSGLYKQTCVTHYFVWGSYTSKTWHEPLELTQRQEEDLVKGVCPSGTHPTPLLHHIPDHCVYTWPTETTTTTLYCITRSTTVRQIVGQPLTSDEEALLPSSIQPGRARTVSGAVVTWNEADIHELDKWITRYEGIAIVTRGQVIIEDLQEGYLLTTKVKEDDVTWGVWNTVEGFQIKLPNSYLNQVLRSRRSELEAVQAEVNAKLQYATTRIEGTLQLAREVCTRQNQLKASVELILRKSADKYAQAIFNTTYITASVTDNLLLVWPCKPVTIWNAYHLRDQDLCPYHLPITYNTLYKGYVDTTTNKIVNQTDWIPCVDIQAQPYEHNGVLYMRTGGGIANLTLKDVAGLPHIGPHGHVAPVWMNHWIYNEQDFHHEGPKYLTARDMELREKTMSAEEENAYYNQYMQIPFIGMPIMPSLTRMITLFAQLGGGIYLVKSLIGWLRICITLRRKHKPHGDTPMELYQLSKRT